LALGAIEDLNTPPAKMTGVGKGGVGSDNRTQTFMQSVDWAKFFLTIPIADRANRQLD
jgi:hypothetical protein